MKIKKLGLHLLVSAFQIIVTITILRFTEGIYFKIIVITFVAIVTYKMYCMIINMEAR